MNRKYRTFEIAFATFVLGLACGYATRLIRVPLPDVTADLRPRLSTDPYLPNDAALGKPINSAGPIAIKPSPEATSPDFVVLDIDSADRIAGITFLYQYITDTFDLKSEMIKRYGQLEHQMWMDETDVGLFRDDSRGILWDIYITEDEDSAFGRRSATLQVRTHGGMWTNDLPKIKPGTRDEGD